MRVSELMSSSVITIEGTASCREAVARMHQAKVRHLPVVDREGGLVGIITDRDLRHHLFARSVMPRIGTTSVEALLEAIPVRDLMSARVVCAAPADDLEAAAARMREGKVGSLPVVDNGRVIGILTETDLLRHVVRASAGCSPGVEEIIVSYP